MLGKDILSCSAFSRILKQVILTWSKHEGLNCSWSVPYGLPVRARCSLCVRNLILSCLLAVYQMVPWNPLQRATWDEYSWWKHALWMMHSPLNFLTTSQEEGVCFTLGSESWDLIHLWRTFLIFEVDKHHHIHHLRHNFIIFFPHL